MDNFKELLTAFKDHVKEQRDYHLNEYNHEEDAFSEGYELGRYLSYTHAAIVLEMLIDEYEKEHADEV